MKRTNLLATMLVLGGVAALIAAAEEPLSYGRDIEPVLLKECGDCHGAENPKKGLDLSQGKGLANLAGATSKEVDMPLLKAGDPAGSYLWLKITHTATQGRGMPRTIFGAKKMPKDKIDLIHRWIVEGAKP
jgi:hypothetical protein